MKYIQAIFLVLSTSALFAATSQVYITNQENGTVSVYDLGSNTVNTIGGFDHPRVIQITPDGSYGYVGDDNNTVRIIDTSTNTVLPIILPINHSTAIAMNGDGTYVYIASENNTVNVIRIADNTIYKSITGFNNLQDIKVSPDGAFAYVTNIGNNTVSVIQTSDHTIIETIEGFNKPLGIEFSKSGNHAYVTCVGDNTVAVIDTTTNTISSFISGFYNPRYMACTRDNAFLYVSNLGNDTVSVVRTIDNTIVATIGIPQPSSVVCTLDGASLCVASAKSTVFTIRIADNAIVGSMGGFQNPSNMVTAYTNSPCNLVNGCQVQQEVNDGFNVFNRVFWQQPFGNPVTYNIYRNASLTDLAGTVDGSTLVFIDSNLNFNQTYAYYVQAVYADGFSTSIGSIIVAPSRRCPPACPNCH